MSPSPFFPISNLPTPGARRHSGRRAAGEAKGDSGARRRNTAASADCSRRPGPLISAGNVERGATERASVPDRPTVPPFTIHAAKLCSTRSHRSRFPPSPLATVFFSNSTLSGPSARLHLSSTSPVSWLVIPLIPSLPSHPPVRKGPVTPLLIAYSSFVHVTRLPPLWTNPSWNY